jgi:DNA invertase Pin-like site-specific DNA recombinase
MRQTDLNARGVGFKSLTENIDTTSSVGKLASHILGALAQFERDIIRERTQAGLIAARARGGRVAGPNSLGPRRYERPEWWAGGVRHRVSSLPIGAGCAI